MSPSLSPSGDFRHAALADSGTVVLSDGPGPRIAVPKAVLSQIFEQVDDGFRLLRRGGVEIGGLLAGPKPEGADLLVEEAVRLQIEYQFGPVFQLSPADFDRLERTVRSIQEPGSDPETGPAVPDLVPRSIVGFYRSMTRGEDALRESDREILEAIEQAEPGLAGVQCCLILVPVSKLEMSVRVAVRNGGDWDQTVMTVRRDTLQATPASSAAEAQVPSAASDTRATEIAVTPAALSVRSREIEEPAAIAERVIRSPQAVPRRPAQPAANSEAPAEVARWNRNIPVYLTIGLALAMALGVGYRWINLRPQAPAPKISQAEPAQQEDRLGFAANRDGSDWKLTWNRDVVDALNPAGATLSIQDGDTERDIDLTNADLSSGALYYSPQGGELAFRFAVRRTGGELVEERVRVLGAIKAQDRLPKPERQPLPVSARAGTQNAGALRDRSTPPAESAASPVPPGPANIAKSVPAAASTPSGVSSAPAVADNTQIKNSDPPARTTPVTPSSNSANSAANLPANPTPGNPPVKPATPPGNPAPGNPAAKESTVADSPQRAAPPAAPPPSTQTRSGRGTPDNASSPEVSVLAVPVPPVLNAPAVPAAPTSLASAQPATSAPPVAPSAKEASPASVPPSSAAVANRTPAPVPVQSSYRGPKPVKQVSPVAPPNRGSVQVQVLVAINAKGKVTKATPVGPLLSVPLTAAATKAAEYWEFDPARLDGKAVPSEMTLIFKF